MLGAISTPPTTCDEVLFGSQLVGDPTPKHHFRVSFLGHSCCHLGQVLWETDAVERIEYMFIEECSQKQHTESSKSCRVEQNKKLNCDAVTKGSKLILWVVLELK